MKPNGTLLNEKRSVDINLNINDIIQSNLLLMSICNNSLIRLITNRKLHSWWPHGCRLFSVRNWLP